MIIRTGFDLQASVSCHDHLAWLALCLSRNVEIGWFEGPLPHIWALINIIHDEVCTLDYTNRKGRQG